MGAHQTLMPERALVALEEQLRLAAEIQRKLLPAIPGEALDCRWCARMVPAYEIGGDFYDFLRISDEAVLVILGDVSGRAFPRR